MRLILCLLLLSASALANKNDDRRTKLPFVADAVGNSLPPPSNVPATVGSPVNLLTPDRYEFYTFDESGELVKRLMTLEEIQAIVAAGEESEGLVTFANDNQPTIAFNFSQPPYTKVHSVVTNVQNVLKAQMEAHKKKPLVQPTFDTPDVSDSWSLILPSIFGNTGVDIVPDKTSGSFTTPETETLEMEVNDEDDNSYSKEGGNQVLNNTTNVDEGTKTVTVTDETLATEEIKTTTSKPATTTTTINPTTTTTSTTIRPTTTTKKPKPTTNKPRTTTTAKPRTSTTKRPALTTTTTTATIKPLTTTTTTTTTTVKPFISTTTVNPTTARIIRTTSKSTTAKIESSTKMQISTTKSLNDISIQPNIITSTESVMDFERLSTFIPVSTVKYVTQRATQKPIESTKATTFASTTKRSVVTTAKPQSISSTIPPKQFVPTKSSAIPTEHITTTISNKDFEKVNTTTITTQSVSPSTTVSSTEFISPENPNLDYNNVVKDTEEPTLPMFDVAQSISQIASDLGSSNYQPIPTTNNLLDTTKINDFDMESKEDLEMDIPTANENEPQNNSSYDNEDKFIKISTIDPHNQPKEKVEVNDEKTIIEPLNKEKITTTESIETTEMTTLAPILSESTTIDPILTESMGDLLSQVVNEAPQSIVDSDKNYNKDNSITTTESIVETTTDANIVTTGSTPTESKNDISNDRMEPNLETNDIKSPVVDLTKDKNENKETKGKDENIVSVSNTTNKNITIVNDDKDSIKTHNTEKKTSIKKDKPQDGHNTISSSNKEKPVEQILAPETTPSPKIEVTTLATAIVTQKFIPHTNKNKINLADKSINTHKKEKNPESSPKVDEFKKKIQKVNIDDEEYVSERNNTWKLIPAVSPPKVNEISKDKVKSENHYTPDNNENKDIVLEFSQENQGLEVTTKDLGEDIAQFAELCNELAFRYWNVLVENIDKKRSFVLSPFSITSMLAMMFMGARGATSGEMNEILKLDDMVTFNPHFTLKNISDSIETTPKAGVYVSAFIRELYSDRKRGKILTFYKERAQHFYNGHVEEINFNLISDIIRRRTNLLVKRYTWGRINEYMKSNSIVMQPPLAAFSTNIFQTDCTGTSVEGRDGEMYFVVSPNVRQRRLVPVPAVVYKAGFLAGYDPVLDATAAALGNTNSVITTLFLMPGQQGNVVHADDLEKLEQRLLEAQPSTPTLSRLLRTLLPRTGLELQIPRFLHKSFFNVSLTLKSMGLKDLFDADHADLGGLNGPSKDLYLSDMLQTTTFVTCGEGGVGEQHHIEEYPEVSGMAKKRRTSRWAYDWDEPRDYQRAFHDPHDVGEAMHLPLHLRPRQARLPTRSAQPARLKYDRPFLYFVRHNPSGMLLYVGRYNPRLLP